jgi:PAS domain S-box-containing protein
MGALMRALDWSRTPLGPVEGWPRALKTCVRIMLTSRQPMWLGWGDELTFLYNDPYRSIVGGKHPLALGRPTAAVWREIWPEIGPRIQAALGGEEGTYDEALLLIMERYGYPEETYYTFSYSPIPDDAGRPTGIFCANTDDTRRVTGERRIALLHDLAAGTAEARTVEDAFALSLRSLESNPWDVPFALLYLLDPDHRAAVLHGTAAITPGHLAAPEVISLDDGSTWPLAQAAGAGAPCLIPNLGSLFGDLPTGTWNRPPSQAVALPIGPLGQSSPSAILIVGLNPYRLFDDDYRGFLNLVAGQIAAAVAAARAYEEERRRAEALAELDRAKTVFFNNISHEFRTPLTLMLGPLEDVLASPGDAGLVREQVAAAHRNTLRLLRLVNTLLDFSRVEGARMEAVYESIDLAVLTTELTSIFRSTVERAGLRLLVDCPPLPEQVYVDGEMWEKIVLNLLSNAFKFTLAGEIAVALRVVGGHAVLTVRDTGTGIPAEELPHIFERFHRVRGARARTHEGTGLGLALAHDLIDLHGGSIGVESVPDVGTTFTITLPLGTAHLPPARIQATRTQVSTALGAAPYMAEALRWLPDHAETAEPPVIADVSAALPAALNGAPRARILLADDNADLRDYLTRLLAARYDVRAVANGAQALAAALDAPPDLVLSDVMMPELDGYGLVRELRADPRTSAIPVVLLSARAGEESTVDGLETGADDYLIKPFSARELLARVGTHLRLAQARREARAALTTERDRLRVEVTARARAEEELRRSHDRLRMALAAARMVAWEWDPRADILDTIGNLADIYGVARLDSSAQGFPLVHPEDRARHEATVRGAETAGNFQSTFRIIRPDTEAVVWLEERGLVVGNQPGDTRRILGVAVDISARVRAEEALRASEARYRAIAETANEGIWLLDPEGRTVFANSRLADILGASLDELSVRLLLDFVPEDDRDEAQQRIGQNLAGMSEQFDFRFRRTDGVMVEVLASTSPVRDGAGSIVGVLGMFSDITARKRLERRTHEAMEALLAMAHALVALPDEVGEAPATVPAEVGIPGVRHLAELARRVLDARRLRIVLLEPESEVLRLAAVVGIETAEEERLRTIPTDSRLDDRFGSDAAARLRRGETVVLPNQFDLLGVTHPHIVPMVIGDRMIGYIAADYLVEPSPAGVDMPAEAAAQIMVLLIERGRLLAQREEARAAELSLRETTRRMDEFLATASHELKTPVTSIRANVQLALRRGRRVLAREGGSPGDPAAGLAGVCDLLERAEGQTGRMVRLLHDLLDVSRLHAGHLEPRPERCDLRNIVADQVEEQRSAWPTRVITYRAPDRPAWVDADPDQLGQVVTNFLTNALKYSAPDRPVVVEMRTAGTEVVVRVCDEGVGLAPAQSARVWERFERVAGVEVQDPTRRAEGGLGLGLYLSRSVVERHGGRVGLESASGAGSTFWFALSLISDAVETGAG